MQQLVVLDREVGSGTVLREHDPSVRALQHVLLDDGRFEWRADLDRMARDARHTVGCHPEVGDPRRVEAGRQDDPITGATSGGPEDLVVSNPEPIDSGHDAVALYRDRIGVDAESGPWKAATQRLDTRVTRGQQKVSG